jgi:mRNA-degrading endonuclease RelE of RelBE toxin-antitoxin system
LAFDPRPPSAGKLAASAFWRLRVGAFRIVYAIDDTTHVIVGVRIARRSESTYRRVR